MFVNWLVRLLVCMFVSVFISLHVAMAALDDRSAVGEHTGQVAQGAVGGWRCMCPVEVVPYERFF